MQGSASRKGHDRFSRCINVISEKFPLGIHRQSRCPCIHRRELWLEASPSPAHHWPAGKKAEEQKTQDSRKTEGKEGAHLAICGETRGWRLYPQEYPLAWEDTKRMKHLQAPARHSTHIQPLSRNFYKISLGISSLRTSSCAQRFGSS